MGFGTVLGGAGDRRKSPLSVDPNGEQGFESRKTWDYMAN
jgi:hypothetical protein